MSYKKQYDEQKWVVFIMDPDYNDSSPYSVVADDEESAIERAISDWRSWLQDDELFEPSEWCAPEIVKVYRGSWIGERVL
jgi:hypothetical protein